MLRTVLVAASLIVPGVASAHAFLQSAVPAVGSIVPVAPGQVVLEYTQGIEPLFSTIEVRDASGARVDTGGVHLAGAPTRLAVALKPLPPGSYGVAWHATSVDTHKTEGKFEFTVSP